MLEAVIVIKSDQFGDFIERVHSSFTFLLQSRSAPLSASKKRLSIRRSQRPQTQPQSTSATASIGQRHLRIAAITPIAYSDCIPHQTPNQSATPQADPALTQHPRPTAASSLDMPNRHIAAAATL
jgi:hypothetical protein